MIIHVAFSFVLNDTFIYLILSSIISTFKSNLAFSFHKLKLLFRAIKINFALLRLFYAVWIRELKINLEHIERDPHFKRKKQKKSKDWDKCDIYLYFRHLLLSSLNDMNECSNRSRFFVNSALCSISHYVFPRGHCGFKSNCPLRYLLPCHSGVCWRTAVGQKWLCVAFI